MVLFIKLFKDPSYILQENMHNLLMFATMPVNICVMYMYMLTFIFYSANVSITCINFFLSACKQKLRSMDILAYFFFIYLLYLYFAICFMLNFFFSYITFLFNS